MVRRHLLLNSTFLVAAAVARMPRTNDDFAFPDTVDDINTVPERARGLYTQDGDKFKFTDVGGLKNSLNSTRQERDAANRAARDAAAYKALGKTPEEIKALMDAANAAEEEANKAAGNWDVLKQQMTENHNNALAEKDKRVKKLETSLEHSLIDSGLQMVLSDPGIGGDPLFLLPHMRGRVKLEETDDGFKPVVLRSDGSPMLNKDNQPANLKDLASEFRGDERFAVAFKGLNKSGGGGTGGGNGGGGEAGSGPKKRSEMSMIEKVAYIKDHGQQEYEKLPE